MRSRLLTAVLILCGLFVTVDRSCAGWYYPPPTNKSPVAILTVYPEYVMPGDIVTLDGSVSYDPDGSITKYEWDFDYDGVFSPDYNEVAPCDGITTHSYGGVSGTYHTAALRVTDNSSATDTHTYIVYMGQTYYVGPNGNDANDGLSWSTAFATIQHAIYEVNDFDVIEVNEGTYNETIDFNGVTCMLTSIDPNNWTVTANTIIEANDANDSVLALDGVDSVIKGFTITGGNRGIDCNDGSPTISHCVIKGNKCDGDGGGMLGSNSSPTISSCFFVENEAENGGAICNINNSSAVFTSCVFSENTADANGGALYTSDSSLTLTNCSIAGNDANSFDGCGGAVYNQNSSFLLDNCIIWGNTAEHGSGIYNDNSELGPDDPNFVSWWKLDEVDGNEVNDSVGDSNGQLVNGPVWTNGIVHGGLSFDGVDDYVSVANTPNLNITGDITISAWVYLERGGTGQDSSCQVIVAKTVANGAINNPFDFRTDASVEPCLTLIRAGASGHDYVYSTEPISIKQWHHVLVRVQNNVPNFYVDGIVTGKTVESFTITPTGNTNPLLIGRRDDGLYFDGAIDDIRIYNRALTDEEVRVLAGVVRYSDIEGCGGSGINWDPNFGIDGGGNIDGTPDFTNSNSAAGSDGIFATRDDGLRLGPDSLCLDAADGDTAPSTDILSHARVDINNVNDTGTGTPAYTDMGAYEGVRVHNIEYSFGGQYGLTGTIGQPDVRYSSGGSYELFGGFWPGWPFLLNP